MTGPGEFWRGKLSNGVDDWCGGLDVLDMSDSLRGVLRSTVAWVAEKEMALAAALFKHG